MARTKRTAVGEGTARRIAARAERPGLERQTLPGGGEVFRGPLATRALKALGARAMTLDRTIVVGEDFDWSRPEDQALYAHERHHVEAGHDGGGGGGVGLYDAEEVAARAAERLALQRAAAGGYEGGYQPGAGSLGGSSPTKAPDQMGRGSGAGSGDAAARPGSVDTNPDPVRGYKKLRERGLSHLDVVDQLARQVLAALDERQAAGLDRHRDKKGWL